MQARQTIIGALMNGCGFHIACWRNPAANLNGTDPTHYVRVAQRAKQGLLDLPFLADSPAMMYGADPQATARIALVNHLEPITLLSSLVHVTRHVGLIASMTTTYNERFHIARKFASLDHLSGGRPGWNLVTSANLDEAQNFGLTQHVDHADRYSRAEESLGIVKGLWDSFADDAIVLNREEAIYYDWRKLRTLNHVGAHFSMRGPLNVPRPPQGHPVIAEAGSSRVGRALGARTADLISTAQQKLSAAQDFDTDIKHQAAASGRDPDTVKMMPGVVIYVGETDDAAREKFALLQSLIHPEVGKLVLSELLGGFDLSSYSIDDPLPAIEETNSGKSRMELLTGLAQDEHLSIRQLYERAAVRGHRIIRGTPGHIADELDAWFAGGAADGFIFIPPFLPGALDDLIRLVVPELQRRGLFKTRYRDGTLRTKLGLMRPARA